MILSSPRYRQAHRINLPRSRWAADRVLVDSRLRAAAVVSAAPAVEAATEAVSAAVAVVAQVVPEADLAEAGRVDEVTVLFRGAEYAAFAWTKSNILITRMLRACGSTCPSAPRSSRAARQVLVLDTSAP